MKMLDRDRTLGPRLVAEIYAQFAVYVDGTNAISKASVAANRSVRICSSVNRFRFMASLCLHLGKCDAVLETGNERFQHR